MRDYQRRGDVLTITTVIHAQNIMDYLLDRAIDCCRPYGVASCHYIDIDYKPVLRIDSSEMTATLYIPSAESDYGDACVLEWESVPIPLNVLLMPDDQYDALKAETAASKKAAEKAQAEASSAKYQQQERETYLRLKAKFEGTPLDGSG
jgi:hypothetical protein